MKALQSEIGSWVYAAVVRLECLVCLVCLVCVFSTGTAAAQTRQNEASFTSRALQLSGDFAGTHDPSIARDGDTYYVFATGAAYPPRRPADHTPSPEDAHTTAAPVPVVGQLPIRCSKDLIAWKRCGEVFSDIPAWIRTASPGTKELWAPDISYFGGLYHLYYAYSLFGKNTSGIALATNKTLDRSSVLYKWVDRGLVLKSGESDDFNAIDPNLVMAEDGVPWLSFGSFWGGIKMRRLDPLTGKLTQADQRTYSLATRSAPANAVPTPPGLPPNWEAVEAPFIVRHEGFYYLFVSWDLCCRGVKSTYRTMVGRSKQVTGPYVDKDGKALSQGGGSPFLSANESWLGPGGESLLVENKRVILVFHAYDAKTGIPSLQVSTLGWKDGWPFAAVREH